MAASQQTNDTRITAAPGTGAYRQQVDRQALAAADAALRLGLVRVVCGLFGAMMVVMVALEFAAGSSPGPKSWFVLPIAAEAFSVALFGRSQCLRLMLSGARQRGKGTDAGAEKVGP